MNDNNLVRAEAERAEAAYVVEKRREHERLKSETILGRLERNMSMLSGELEALAVIHRKVISGKVGDVRAADLHRALNLSVYVDTQIPF